MSAGALLSAEPVGPPSLREGPLLGALFESLVTLSVRVYAQAARARVSHLRTRNGDHEVDLIVERRDGRILAIETKLAAVPDDRDVRHLHWLAQQIGQRPARRGRDHDRTVCLSPAGWDRRRTGGPARLLTDIDPLNTEPRPYPSVR